jgi:hypothetical protein
VPTVEVVFTALDAEAKKWRDLAPVMAAASKTAQDLILTPGAFFAGTDLVSMITLTPAYDNLKDLVVKMCNEAAAEYGQLEQAMVRAKEQYQRVDGDAARNLSVPIFGT